MITTFWRWFFWGVPGGRQGWRVLVRWSLLFHASVAALMLALLKAAPIEFAGKALFPAASILVSMAVAWTSRAATILQDSDFRSKIVGEENPIEDYVYGYQLSLLIIIIMVSYISIMASGGIVVRTNFYFPFEVISGFFLYFMLSLSVGQCWRGIDFSNLLTLLHQRVKG